MSYYKVFFKRLWWVLSPPLGFYNHHCMIPWVLQQQFYLGLNPSVFISFGWYAHFGPDPDSTIEIEQIRTYP